MIQRCVCHSFNIVIMELIKTNHQMCSSRSLKFSFVKEDATEKDQIKPQKFAQPPLKERKHNQ